MTPANQSTMDFKSGFNFFLEKNLLLTEANFPDLYQFISQSDVYQTYYYDLTKKAVDRYYHNIDMFCTATQAYSDTMAYIEFLLKQNYLLFQKVKQYVEQRASDKDAHWQKNRIFVTCCKIRDSFKPHELISSVIESLDVSVFFN